MTYEFYARREDPQFDSFTVEPMGGALGATIKDIDITQPLDEQQAEEIRQALVYYQVIFFRRPAFYAR